MKQNRNGMVERQIGEYGGTKEEEQQNVGLHNTSRGRKAW